MEVKINETQYKAILKAVTQISNLYENGMSAFNEVLKNSLKSYNDEIDFSDIDIVFVKNDEFAKNLKAVTEKEWNDVNISVLEKTLDLFIRIGLGQWNELAYFSNNFYLEESTLKDLSFKRSLILNYWDLPGSVTYASLGVGSDKLDDDIKIIYDFYKVLMFEDGFKGCYGSKPFAFSNEPLPKITISETLVTPEDIEKMISSPEEGRKNIIVDIDGIWLPIDEYTSRLYQPDKYDFFRRKNGYFTYKRKAS